MPAKKDKAPKELLNFELPKMPEHLLVRYPERWVQVHFRLNGLSAMNDIIRLPSSSTLYMVEQKIIEHYGNSVTKLSCMWRNSVGPSNIIRDLNKTLNDEFNLPKDHAQTISDPVTTVPSYALYNLGAKKQAGLDDHHVVLHFDYKAHESECPLLLRSPRYERLEAELEKKDREKEAKEKEKAQKEKEQRQNKEKSEKEKEKEKEAARAAAKAKEAEDAATE